MDLIRIFQHDKETVLRESVYSTADISNDVIILKETPKDKEELINVNKAKISRLEAEVEELKKNNEVMRKEIEEKDEVEQEMNEVILNYECLIEKLMQEHRTVKIERELARNHLANLELAFHDLIEKYERAKTIIMGYDKNEHSFMEHLAKFETAVDRIENKYTDFKSYAVEKLNEANTQLKKTDKEYVQEVTKLKAKIIQSHVKIKELERQVTRLTLKSGIGDNGLKNESSIFEPLINNIS